MIWYGARMKTWHAWLGASVIVAAVMLGTWAARPRYQLAATDKMIFRVDVHTGEVSFQHLEVPGTGWVVLGESAQLPTDLKKVLGR